MSSEKFLGATAIVVGAGVGGLFAAGALKDHFRNVIVLERDSLPAEVDFRIGVPQGPHGHAVLKRGENIAEEFFPGFCRRLQAAGGVELDIDKDAGRYEQGKWSEPTNSGLTIFSQSRALLEHVLRMEAVNQPNISIRDGVKVTDFILSDGVVTGVQLDLGSGNSEVLHGDIVIEASGRSGKLPDWLADNGFGEVPTDTLGINLVYVTGIFAAETLRDDYPILSTTREMPPKMRGGTAMPIENTQWMVTLNGRQGDVPPLDKKGFYEFAKSLPIPVVYERMCRSELVGRLKRFIIAQSYWRHYEQLTTFPENLIPVGDAVAGFNPVFGQGMSAAAVDAAELKQCLDRRAAAREGLTGLPAEYFSAILGTVAAAWNSTATYDLLYESTEGVRPDDFPQRRAGFLGMQELAAEDPEIRLKRLLIGNMLLPGSSLYSEDILNRLQAKIEMMDA